MQLLAFLWACQICFFPPDFENLYPKDYKKAADFLKNNKSLFIRKATEYKLSPQILSAIVFPELMRYDPVRDYLETNGLSVAYDKAGTVAGDFSIGYFQMKPSFVEALEIELGKNIAKNAPWALPFKKISLFSQKNGADIRAERFNRLQKIEWQLDYLAGFYQLVVHKFEKELKNKDKKAQLKFISTAYNAGFQRKGVDVEKLQTYRCFPYGHLAEAHTQYAYSEVVMFYYEQKAANFFNN